MNKSEFINELSKKTNLSEEESGKINEILEGTLFVGKKNKTKIVSEIVEKINVSEEEADNIYNSSMDLLKDGLIDKINPFN